MTRSGADLALLLLSGYRMLVEDAMAELSRHGFDDFRPGHEFALRAIDGGATNASALGRALGVSKQAAAKTIATLDDRGYVASESDPADKRRHRLRVTPRGRRAMSTGEAAFEGLRRRLEERVGTDALFAMEKTLAAAVGERGVRPEAPGWAASEGG